MTGGCAGGKTQIGPVTTTLVRHTNSAPPVIVTAVKISWVQNYDPAVSNEVTVIIGSPDLTVPRINWPKIFVGATNWCEVLITNTKMFFNAYNEVSK